MLYKNKMMIQTVHKYRVILFTHDLYMYGRDSLPSKENGPATLVKDEVPLTYCKNIMLKKTVFPLSSLKCPDT